MSSPVRTPDGFKSNTQNLAGTQSIGTAGPNPVDAEIVQFYAIDNSGGAATKVVNMPSAADLFGRGMGVAVITAGAAPADVDLVAQAGETINGGASANFPASATILVFAESKTELRTLTIA